MNPNQEDTKMEELKLATYLTHNSYHGHSSINRYHWEVGFHCYRVDLSKERALGILVNGKVPQDYMEVVFFNHKGETVRRSKFTDRKEANRVVKSYVTHGFRREA